MPAFASRVARAVYRSLPRRAQIAARSALGGALFARRMRGPVPASWPDRSPVSIVIPSYNDLPFLKKCLASVERTCDRFDYEVLVVDDYCEPANRERLKRVERGRVRLILRDERGGFAKAVNTGIREARWDVVLLNSDTVAQPGWLDSLQRAAYTNDRVGLVSPMLVYPDGLIQYGGTYHARRLAPQWYGHLYVGRAANDPAANQPWFIRSVSGACVYIRREVVDAIGGLDEQFWLGFEDVDYGLRAWRAGFRSRYEPSAKLVHHESASRGYSQGKRELGSMRYYWSKWASMVLERGVTTIPAVSFLMSSASTPLWRDYVAQLAREFGALGVQTVVQNVAGAIDEGIVAQWEHRAAIVVATDRGAVETAWLATQGGGIPAYLLPGIDADSSKLTNAERLSAAAGYRPEFDYVAPNRWSADRLAAHSAWETRAIIPPVLAPPPLPTETGSGIVTVGGSAAERATVDAVAARHATTTEHLSLAPLAREDLKGVASARPRVVVSFVDHDHSMEPLALMSLGAAYMGLTNERTRYEVLDGYNALLFGRGESDSMAQSLEDALTDDAVYSELRVNGHHSATVLHDANATHVHRTFADLAARAY